MIISFLDESAIDFGICVEAPGPIAHVNGCKSQTLDQKVFGRRVDPKQ